MLLKSRALIIISLLLLPLTSAGQSFLSDLTASKNDPLFATYAAPMHRSQFILDEGYQFTFYENGNGIDFETDQAGELGIVFKLDGEVRYALGQLHSEPEISVSYPDLVRYHYEPFKDIYVEVLFQVYSSRQALQDVMVTNQRDTAVNLSVYPFLHHRRGIKTIQANRGPSYFTFSHREPADGWTKSHDVPFIEDVKNLFILNSTPHSMGWYTALGNAKNKFKATLQKEDLPDQNYVVQYGKVYNSDGSENEKTPPQAQQIILHNNDGKEILTEQAPKWGDTDPNIPGNGFQGAELGNFQNPEIKQGDTFTVIFTDMVTGERGSVSDVIPSLPADNGIAVDPINLAQRTYPDQPDQFNVTFSNGQDTAFVSWKDEEGLIYDLYRRYNTRRGRFDRIAEGLTDSKYTDANLIPDSTYMYTLIARDSQNSRSPHTSPRGEIVQTDLFTAIRQDSLDGNVAETDGKAAAFQLQWSLESGESKSYRSVRMVAPSGTSTDSMVSEATRLFDYEWRQDISRNEQLYQSVPSLDFDDPDRQMMYWNAFTLMRQVFYPPENLTNYNYYVFSREPTWGWGHGGQVFHESLSMLAYVFMDAESAKNSQRVYMERQQNNGYIDYRSGGYLSEQIPTQDGELTSSAPWFNWENWMIYQESGDQKFLQDAYSSGKKFFNFWLENRDKDGDGLMEWGGVAFLESVRDGLVAVWDNVGAPENFESLALNTMLVKEASSLSNMASELGYQTEAANWQEKADSLSNRINDIFWDEETDFYYMVDRNDHDFIFNGKSLKRQEIIGFLPLWSETATTDQAGKLVEVLTDSGKFWRKHGIPSLAADDPYYDPAGYWNGPVWVQWEYLIFRGLLNYGYDQLARELAQKVFNKVIFHLKRDHTFWEMYSPDSDWAGHHQTYIWTGLVARMMIDLQREVTAIEHDPIKQNMEQPKRVMLARNAPNPFNPSTTLSFYLPNAQSVTLKIYNMLGQNVATLINEKRKQAGRHRVNFDSNDLSSGIYFYQLKTPGRTLSRKMTILK